VSCSLLPEGLDAGDSKPEELSPAGVLGRLGPPHGHARRGRHAAVPPVKALTAQAEITSRSSFTASQARAR
jgi:hypothetical protein